MPPKGAKSNKEEVRKPDQPSTKKKTTENVGVQKTAVENAAKKKQLNTGDKSTESIAKKVKSEEKVVEKKADVKEVKPKVIKPVEPKEIDKGKTAKKVEKEKVSEPANVKKSKKPVQKVESESEDSSSDDDDAEGDSLASDLVVNKYATAASIANEALKTVLAAIKEGAIINELCDIGDKCIESNTSKMFKNDKDLAKGIATPTCISVNNCICHFSPLRSDPPVVLQNGQMVKVELGVHIDGYISTVAHTTVVGASKDNKIKGKQARVMLSAYTAMNAAIRMLRPDQYKNVQVTDMIDKIADIYKVKPVEGMVSHQLEKDKIEGEKQIVQNPGEKKSDIPKCTFGKHEAYAIDVLMSTGEGKKKLGAARTTVYKKNTDTVYSLRVKSSRNFFSQAVNKFGCMPFSLRAFDESQSRLGVVECERHKLLEPYQVWYEKEGEYVAQFKSTVLLLGSGIICLTGFPCDLAMFDCNVKINDKEVVDLLNTRLKTKRRKRAKRKAKPVADVQEKTKGSGKKQAETQANANKAKQKPKTPPKKVGEEGKASKATVKKDGKVDGSQNKTNVGVQDAKKKPESVGGVKNKNKSGKKKVDVIA